MKSHGFRGLTLTRHTLRLHAACPSAPLPFRAAVTTVASGTRGDDGADGVAQKAPTALPMTLSDSVWIYVG